MGPARFLHSGDWQLGLTRHYFEPGAQDRFAQARIDAIRALGRIAAAERCECLVVAGDVFESNHVQNRTVLRALEALGEVPVPVYLLPGNHDSLEPGSVYDSPVFTRRKPEHVHVLADGDPRTVRPGLEIAGAPWTSKRPLADLAAAAVAGLAPAPATRRVLVAHGAVDVLSPDAGDPAAIRLAALEAALDDGRIHYVALGDRHSTTRVGSTGRVWYAGTPEPTDYDEVDAGRALVVELADDGATVRPVEVGTWRFRREQAELTGAADLALLERRLAAIPDKARTILKLSCRGTLSLADHARLEALLDGQRELFAALELWERHTDLAVLPSDGDFAGLDLAGFARTALERLRAAAAGGGPEAGTARDALALLVRLAARPE